MAGLTLSYDAPHGFTAAGAYARIHAFTGTQTRVTFHVGIWYSETAHDENRPFLREFKYTVPYQDGMTIDSLYPWLTTREEFKDATVLP